MRKSRRHKTYCAQIRRYVRRFEAKMGRKASAADEAILSMVPSVRASLSDDRLLFRHLDRGYNQIGTREMEEERYGKPVLWNVRFARG